MSTKLTDEGLQAVGTAWCNILLCTIPHQSPTAPASPLGKPKRTPTLPNGIKPAQICRGDHRSPVFALHGRATDGRPYGIAETAHNPGGHCLSPAVIKPSPLGKVSTKLTDEGLQAVGTAWCNILLCTIPHQSPTAPASPPGKPKRTPTLPNGIKPAQICRGDHWSPVFALHGWATDGRPYGIAETAHNPGGHCLSPAASKPSPLGGRYRRTAGDEG